MRLSNWLRDHRTQCLIGLAGLLIAILALARDISGFEVDHSAREREPKLAATSASPSDLPSIGAVRRGPTDLLMVGGATNVLETEVDLDSEAPNWEVNSCGAHCDLNFRGSLHGIEEAYGQMALSPADHESCRSATTYGYTLSPQEATVGAEVCVRTDEGRFAGLVVTDVRKSNPDHVESITFEVTVWEK
jgi:hypothetical protein